MLTPFRYTVDEELTTLPGTLPATQGMTYLMRQKAYSGAYFFGILRGCLAMTTIPVSLDLDPKTLDRLAERERETGQSQSALAQQYIEEGLRMARYPDIF